MHQKNLTQPRTEKVVINRYKFYKSLCNWKASIRNVKKSIEHVDNSSSKSKD